MTAAARTHGPLRVTVLRGGPSAEREVSLQSGRAVADALRRRGHRVFESDIGPDDLGALAHAADVVFPVLHGTFGEDGSLQAILEERGQRFVGSGARASALAMDKVAAKRVLAELGAATPACEVWTEERAAARHLPALALPVIVKPVDQGSSVGTTIVREPGAFAGALRLTLAHSRNALVEQFIDGAELTVGIIGTQALPPICIRPRRTFYDYVAKYEDDATEYVFDAFPVEVLARAQDASWRGFAALGCRHLGRVDWMIDAAGALWFLEVNTIPGFTSHSLVPKAAARLGISFDELVDRLVRMPLEETC